MRPDDTPDWFLLDAYFSGSASDEERATVEHWIASSVGRAALMPRFRAAWETRQAKPVQHWATEEAKATVLAGIALSTRPSRTERGGHTRSTSNMLGRFTSWPGIITSGAIAAALVVAVMTRPGGETQANDSGGQEYHTTRAQRATFSLPDGSRVVLAPDSRVRFTVESSGARRVDLEGQAYFTVAHDPRHPFWVATPHTRTEVLGTAFAVQDYADDHAAQVAVADGKVATVAVGSGQPARPVVLLPGDVGALPRGHAFSVRRDLATGDVFGWMHGQVAFRDTPLRDVVRVLSRTYDLDIRLADDTLGDLTVNLQPTSQSGHVVIEMITLAVGIKYLYQGSIVTLSR